MHLLHENMQAKDRELASVLQRNRELQSEYAQLSATYADRCVLSFADVPTLTLATRCLISFH